MSELEHELAIFDQRSAVEVDESWNVIECGRCESCMSLTPVRDLRVFDFPVTDLDDRTYVEQIRLCASCCGPVVVR